MGRLTFAEIVSEGLELAGDTSLTGRANVWLQAILDKLYRRAAWPFLQRTYQGVALPAAASYVDFGVGSGTTDDIARVNRVVVTDGVAGGYVGEAPVLDPDSADASQLPGVLRSGSGAPTYFIVEAEGGTPNRWRLFPNVTPDKQYTLIILANRLPQSGSDDTSIIPPYENDETMIQGVFARALKHQDDPRAENEQRAFERMVASDMVTQKKQGRGTTWGLSKKRFKGHKRNPPFGV